MTTDTGSPFPRLCVLCHNEVLSLDDVQFIGEHGRITCVACFRRYSGSEVRMDPKLLQQLEQTVKDAP